MKYQTFLTSALLTTFLHTIVYILVRLAMPPMQNCSGGYADLFISTLGRRTHAPAA